MDYFNKWARTHNEMHPIAKQIHELMQELEKLPPSLEQTDYVTRLGKIRDEVGQRFEFLEKHVSLGGDFE